ncbi:MAG: hypothetical protein JSW11_00995 [Candidatus Heimdallarchaeota archaeon]|nr:MAG: hypothetical protein JSW11_00995 [Candidatus Heimdallarchaeota archaeon]
MIRTKNYLIVKFNKKHGWLPVKEYGSIEFYSWRDAQEVLRDIRNGEIEGHSKNCQYKIMQLSYCDINQVTNLLLV